MSTLVLVRHGKSEWNEKGLWTGWRDIPLAPKGIEEAKNTGEALKDLHFDTAYTSALIRAQQTLDEILKVINQTPPITEDKALNERDYGDYTEKNKWDIQKELGEEEFQKIRRSWDYPPPNGESLKMVYERVLPYYKQEIEPKLIEGKNIIIAAHGNSLRALVKYLESVSDDNIATLEIGTGEAYIYEIDTDGKVINKEIRGMNENKGNV
ncbi:MAG: 2,3-bisphosphoglycerate-dependent phosphoglycerate mutase [Candidatus Levybacteria bacterium]|nr:2,3-bisphosphoglycerate-dependent phosphoglycerate mutase [Candidatus Levybacteria bacterium]